MEFLVELFVIVVLFVSAAFWYRSATLDDSNSEIYEFIEGADKESIQNTNIPKFDDKNFYMFFCITWFLLKNYRKLDLFCVDKKRYDCLVKNLNASAALYAFIATSIQCLLNLEKRFLTDFESRGIVAVAFILGIIMFATIQKINKKSK